VAILETSAQGVGRECFGKRKRHGTSKDDRFGNGELENGGNKITYCQIECNWERGRRKEEGWKRVGEGIELFGQFFLEKEKVGMLDR